MYGIDCVAAASEEVQITGTSSSSDDLNSTITTTDPWMLFLYALKAPATKEKYIQRLTKFLDFLGYQGTRKRRLALLQIKQDEILYTHSTQS